MLNLQPLATCHDNINKVTAASHLLATAIQGQTLYDDKQSNLVNWRYNARQRRRKLRDAAGAATAERATYVSKVAVETNRESPFSILLNIFFERTVIWEQKELFHYCDWRWETTRFHLNINESIFLENQFLGKGTLLPPRCPLDSYALDAHALFFLITVASNDVDRALGLYEEKREADFAITTNFLSKLASFLKSLGKEVPFDLALLSQVTTTTLCLWQHGYLYVFIAAQTSFLQISISIHWKQFNFYKQI